jgi:hypothetical protein
LALGWHDLVAGDSLRPDVFSPFFREVSDMSSRLIAKLLPVVLSVACLAAALALPSILTAPSAQAAAAATPAANVITIKGKCVFSGQTSTWSGKLTPRADGDYDAKYVAAWGGNKAMTYEGTVKTDFKTEISGNGKSTGGGGNGTFEFSGKFNDKGVAQCSYKEAAGGRGRNGTLTVESVTR